MGIHWVTKNQFISTGHPFAVLNRNWWGSSGHLKSQISSVGIQWVSEKSNLFCKNVMSGHPVGNEKPVRIDQWESTGRLQIKYIFQWASGIFQKLLKESGRKIIFTY